jgi:hypothetical protein
MGVKFAREYEKVIDELTENIVALEAVYDFLGINQEEWEAFSKTTKVECAKTLADDVFYALGEEKEMAIGEETIVYDQTNHCIVFNYTSGLSTVIRLI